MGTRGVGGGAGLLALAGVACLAGCGPVPFRTSAFYSADLIGAIKPYLAGQAKALSADEREWSGPEGERYRELVFNLAVAPGRAPALFEGLKAEVLKAAQAEGAHITNPDTRQPVSEDDLASVEFAYTGPPGGRGRLRLELAKGEVELFEKEGEHVRGLSPGGPDSFVVIVSLRERPSAR